MNKLDLFSRLKKVLLALNWKFRECGKTAIKGFIQVGPKNCSYIFSFFVSVEDKGVWALEVYEEKIKQTPALLELLFRINEKRLLGAFQYDFNTSCICYKYASPNLIIEYGDKQDLDEFLMIPARMLARFMPIIVAVSNGTLPLEKAIAQLD